MSTTITKTTNGLLKIKTNSNLEKCYLNEPIKFSSISDTGILLTIGVDSFEITPTASNSLTTTIAGGATNTYTTQGTAYAGLILFFG
jgi:hypothetical protein